LPEQLLRSAVREIRGVTNGKGSSAEKSLEMWLLTAGDDRRLRAFELDTSKEAFAVSQGGYALDIAVPTGADRIALLVGSFPGYAAAERTYVIELGSDAHIFEGVGDLRAIAEGAGRYPYRMLRQGILTIIEEAATGGKLAAYPFPLTTLVTGRDGRTWCGAYGRHVHLEGVKARSPFGDLTTTGSSTVPRE
jgi:hypothetical protein